MQFGRAHSRAAGVLAAGSFLVACADGASPERERADAPEPPGTTILEQVEVLSTDPLMTVYGSAEPACAECRVRLEPAGAFGRLQDTILLREIPHHVERDSRGRFYAIPHRHSEDHELILYEPDGPIVRTVGGRGSGPGEFRQVDDLRVGPGDSLYVLHRAMISVFDSAGQHAATVRLNPVPARWTTARLVGIVDPGEYGGRYLLNGAYADREGAGQGHPLDLFDAQGRYVRSFGPPGLAEARRPGAGLGRRTALAHDGSIWLSNATLRIEKVGMDGSQLRIIGVADHPDAQWWIHPLFMTREEYEQYLVDGEAPGGPGIRGERPPRYPDGPPNPPGSRLEGFVDLGDDLVAVVLWAASRNWQEATVEWDPRFPAEPQPLPGWRQQRYDTVVDVIHVPTGVVVARSERVPGDGYVTSDGTLIFPRVTDIGIITVNAFELEVDIRAGGLPFD